jgi:hypothetical protein
MARTQQIPEVAQSTRVSTKLVNFNLQIPGANTPLIPKNQKSHSIYKIKTKLNSPLFHKTMQNTRTTHKLNPPSPILPQAI